MNSLELRYRALLSQQGKSKKEFPQVEYTFGYNGTTLIEQGSNYIIVENTRTQSPAISINFTRYNQHYYYASAEFTCFDNDAYCMLGLNFTSNNGPAEIVKVGEVKRISCRHYIGKWNNAYMYIPYGANGVIGARTKIENFMLYDLTEIFGAGNEPTLEEFEEMIGVV